MRRIRWFHKILSFFAATREIAFIQAISAAAIIHEIAQQCAQNKIPGCGCRPSDPIWSKCDDYISIGEKQSRPFTDRFMIKKRPDAQTLVSLHNNAVGREVTHAFHLRSLRPYCYFASHFRVYVTVRRPSKLRSLSDTSPGHFVGRS